jgi:hypothetical protein
MIGPWDFVAPHIEYADLEIADKRLNICKSCDHLSREDMVCKKCWCFMPEKTKLLNVVCPLGKW